MRELNRIFGTLIAVSLLASSAPLALAQTPSSSKASATKAQEPAGKMRTHRFRQDDYRRRYMLYSPANERAFTGPRPLVLVIHGGGSTDRGMIKLDEKRWQTLADEHGFYVVYPNAVDRLWDFGEGTTSDDLDNRVDDLAYFRRVMDDVSRKKNIDQSRIFASGISRGGQASYYLACNLPDRIRAIMPVAMSLPEFMVNECELASSSGVATGVAIINGTKDPQVPYEGGPITVFGKLRDTVLSTDKTVALWQNRNGCSSRPDSVNIINKPGDLTSVHVSEWTSCKGAPLKLYKVVNGGHTWPSGIQYLSPRIVGYTSNDIDASEEGWKFFSQF